MSARAEFAPSVGACASLACLLEATSPKLGNVHPRASFSDVEYGHFVTSALIIGPILDRAAQRGVGPTVREAVGATMRGVGANTNLGTLLLLGPLAAVPADQPLREGLAGVLAALGPDATADFYAAIRLASPGGLGAAAEADVTADAPPRLPVVEVMRLAADRDMVARQFTNGFLDVFDRCAAEIEEASRRGESLFDAILLAQLRLMALHGDSLIERKCGAETAQQAKARAAAVLQSRSEGADVFLRRCSELDAWFRADGHRRNPGTTADLLAAGLFVLLREGRLDLAAAIQTIRFYEE